MPQRLATEAEVLRIAPKLCDQCPQPLGEILAYTGSMISLECWGDKAARGHALLTAHWLCLMQSQGTTTAGGALASRSIGKASESFSVPSYSTEDAQLMSTIYGQQFVQLRQSLCFFGIAG